MDETHSYLDKSNWELLVESKAPVEPGAADGALDAEDMLCVAPVVTLAEENVVGADMTCVCRRGNRNACKQNQWLRVSSWFVDPPDPLTDIRAGCSNPRHISNLTHSNEIARLEKYSIQCGHISHFGCDWITIESNRFEIWRFQDYFELELNWMQPTPVSLKSNLESNN